jgi:hypothetical protein
MAKEPVTPENELLAIAERERVLATACNDPSVEGPVAAIEKAAEIVGKAWGGSWLGYQSRVYYKGLKSPPPGVHFSAEWGLMEMGWIDGTTMGDWEEFADADIENRIRRLAGNPDLESARELAKRVARQFEADKAEIASLISTQLSSSPDAHLESLKKELDKLRLRSEAEIVNSIAPRVFSLETAGRLTKASRPLPISQYSSRRRFCANRKRYVSNLAVLRAKLPRT